MPPLAAPLVLAHYLVGIPATQRPKSHTVIEGFPFFFLGPRRVLAVAIGARFSLSFFIVRAWVNLPLAAMVGNIFKRTLRRFHCHRPVQPVRLPCTVRPASRTSGLIPLYVIVHERPFKSEQEPMGVL